MNDTAVMNWAWLERPTKLKPCVYRISNLKCESLILNTPPNRNFHRMRGHLKLARIVGIPRMSYDCGAVGKLLEPFLPHKMENLNRTRKLQVVARASMDSVHCLALTALCGLYNFKHISNFTICPAFLRVFYTKRKKILQRPSTFNSKASLFQQTIPYTRRDGRDCQHAGSRISQCKMVV